MKTNKSMSALGLLFEGFRQCKMIGILTLIITALGAALPPIGVMISAEEDYVREVVNAYEINPLMMLVLLAIPLMALMLFHFLDSRAASDLYHALPHKRITLYVSYAGAILLWLLLLIVVSSLVSVIFCAFSHDYIKLMMDSVVPFAASVFLMSLLIVGGMLVAMSLTGTIFTNIILTGLILFLPRFCYSVLRTVTLSSIPFVSSTGSSGIFANENNLLVTLLVSLFDMDASSSIYDVLSPQWQSVVYTLVLALIYLALGAWVFCRRRSEAAGQSAPTRMHQHVYRIVLTMAYCVFVTAIFVNDLFEGDVDAGVLFGYAVLYLIGILIYFIYELITTKRWRNLLTALPGLAVVAVLNVGVGLGVHLAQNHIVAQRPAASEIESISVGVDDGMIGRQYGAMDYSTYVSLASGNIQITDPTAISLVSYYLDENIKTWETGEDAYWNKYYTSRANEEQTYLEYHVTIRTKHDELARTVLIPVSESDKMMTALESNPDYMSIWRNPPEPIDGTMYSVTGMENKLNDEDMAVLFDQYREEMKAAPFDELYAKQSNYETADVIIQYSFNDDGSIYELECPIYADLMPKTLEKFYQMIYDKQAMDMDKLEEEVQSGKYTEISVDAYNETINAYSYGSGENINEVFEQLKSYILDEPVQAGGAYVYIWLYPEDYNEDNLGLMLPLRPEFFNDEFIREHFEFVER